MDAKREKELAKVKERIQRAEALRDELLMNKDSAWEKVQDHINELERQNTFLMKQPGESLLYCHAALHWGQEIFVICNMERNEYYAFRIHLLDTAASPLVSSLKHLTIPILSLSNPLA